MPSDITPDPSADDAGHDASPDLEEEAEAKARDDDAHTARLRLVLRLIAQHIPQCDIARRFGVTDRTVRRWVEEARRRRLGTFKRATADELLADTDFLHADLKARLLRRLDAAETGNDYRLALDCVRQLRGIERDRYAIRSRIGAFANWNPPQPGVSNEVDNNGSAPSLAAIAAYLHHGSRVASGAEQQIDDSMINFARPTVVDEDHSPLF